MKTPLVSIIIPCYNSEKYIEECIVSVLGQTYKNIQVIVVDDCSTDSSYDLVEEKFSLDDRVVLLRNDVNSGVNKTRHFGVSKSTGDYICFLDSDDLFFPDKVDRQVKLLEGNKEVVLCHTGVEFLGAYDGTILPGFNYFGPGRTYALPGEKYYLKSNYICASSVMFRKELLQNIAFNKKQLFQYEDFVMWTVLGHRGLYSFIEEPLTRYRCHHEAATYKIHKSELVKYYSYLEYCLTCFSYHELGLRGRVKLVGRILFALKKIVKVYADR